MTTEREGSGPGGEAGTGRRVVVGVDDSAGGLAALGYGAGMARDGDSQLVAVRSSAPVPGPVRRGRRAGALPIIAAAGGRR